MNTLELSTIPPPLRYEDVLDSSSAPLAPDVDAGLSGLEESLSLDGGVSGSCLEM